MKKVLIIGFSAMLLIITAFLGTVEGIPETTINFTLLPGEYDGSPLVFIDKDSVDVKVSSDNPVDIYILKQDQVMNVDSGSFDYEKKWEGKTSLDVNYKIKELDTMYYIMVMNPSSSNTANVELEYKIYQEIAGEIAEDAFQDACCGGTVIAGLVVLAAMVAIGIYTKKRN